MTDNEPSPKTKSKRGRFLFLNPEFCLVVFLVCLAFAICRSALLYPPPMYRGFIIADITWFLGIFIALPESIIGFVRWPKQGMGSRICTIILLLILLIIIHPFLPVL